MQTSLELKEVDKLNKHPKFDPKNLTNQVSHLFHDSGRLVVGMHPKEHLLEDRVKWPNDKSKQCGWEYVKKNTFKVKA